MDSDIYKRLLGSKPPWVQWGLPPGKCIGLLLSLCWLQFEKVARRGICDLCTLWQKQRKLSSEHLAIRFRWSLSFSSCLATNAAEMGDLGLKWQPTNEKRVTPVMAWCVLPFSLQFVLKSRAGERECHSSKQSGQVSCLSSVTLWAALCDTERQIMGSSRLGFCFVLPLYSATCHTTQWQCLSGAFILGHPLTLLQSFPNAPSLLLSCWAGGLLCYSATTTKSSEHLWCKKLEDFNRKLQDMRWVEMKQ